MKKITLFSLLSIFLCSAPGHADQTRKKRVKRETQKRKDARVSSAKAATAVAAVTAAWKKELEKITGRAVTRAEYAAAQEVADAVRIAEAAKLTDMEASEAWNKDGRAKKTYTDKMQAQWEQAERRAATPAVEEAADPA